MTSYENIARVLEWTKLPVPKNFWYGDAEGNSAFLSDEHGIKIYEISEEDFRDTAKKCIEHTGTDVWGQLEDTDDEYDFIMCYHMFGPVIFSELVEDPFTEDEEFTDEL